MCNKQLPLKDCDILITVTSENCKGNVAAPMFVNKVLEHIDCQLTFSLNPSKTTGTL
jgi:hypothetical protein